MSLICVDSLDNEVIWLLFLCLGQQWIVREGFSICSRWREIVRTHCLLIDSAECCVNRVVIRRVPHLRTLNFNATVSGLTKNDLACLLDLRALTIRWQSGLSKEDALSNLSDTLVTLSVQGDYHLSSLPNLCNLRTLDLSYNCTLNDTMIGSLTTLQSLTLSYCANVTGNSIRTLSSLRTLALTVADVSDDALSSLVNLTSLEVAWSSNITNQSIQRLTGLTELTLRRIGGGINEDSLAGLHSLTHLCVSGRNASVNYNALTQLKSLAIYTGQHSRHMFNDRRIHTLTNLVTLVADDHLILSSRWLSHFPSLRHLSMDSISIDDTLSQAERRQFTVLEWGSSSEKHCLLK